MPRKPSCSVELAVTIIVTAALTSFVWNFHVFSGGTPAPQVVEHKVVASSNVAVSPLDFSQIRDTQSLEENLKHLSKAFHGNIPASVMTILSNSASSEAKRQLAAIAANKKDGQGEEKEVLSHPVEEKPKKSTEDVVRPKIIYTILSSANYHQNRVRRVLQTWGRHVNIAFIGSTDEDPNLPLIKKFEPKGKETLGLKTIQMLVHLCQNWKDQDYYVMTDDDTFVVAHNLEWYLQKHHNPDEHLYGGYTLTHLADPIVGGGGGIVFSRKTMNAFCDASGKPGHVCHVGARHAGAGDAAVLYCMKALGVKATHLNGFYPFPVHQMIDQPSNWCTITWWFPKHIQCPPIGPTLTFHYIPEDRYLEYYYWSYNFTQMIPPTERKPSPYLNGQL